MELRSQATIRQCLVQAVQLCLVTLIAAYSHNAFALWQAVASWNIVVGGSVSGQTYSGYGSSQAQAFDQARKTCARAQALEGPKLQCMFSSPTRGPDFKEVSLPPQGSYLKSCGYCRMEGDVLACDFCKPVMRRVELNLAQCTAEQQTMLENCHGGLVCGVCPLDVKPQPAQGATRGFYGYCGPVTGAGRKCTIAP